MRICTDGFMDLRDQRRVRTPGDHSPNVDPLPIKEAMSFLLSHTFPGHRRVVRPLTEEHRKRLRLAYWSDSVADRMSRVDRVWRSITEPAPPPEDLAVPQLIQHLQVGPDWVFPLYLLGESTQAIPPGGVASWETAPSKTRANVPVFEMEAEAMV
jgi:hypothetical protein